MKPPARVWVAFNRYGAVLFAQTEKPGPEWMCLGDVCHEYRLVPARKAKAKKRKVKRG